MKKTDIVMRHCRQCDKRFRAKTYNQLFCSGKCRNRHHNDIKYEAMQQYRKHQEAGDE